MRRVLSAELTKIATVRSTAVTLAASLVIGVAMAALVATSFRVTFDRLPADQQGRFDPLYATLYGQTLAQLTLVVFGVLAVTSEYSTGTAAASLLAMPRRGRWYAGKLAAVGLTALGVAIVGVLLTFAVGQAALGRLATSLTAPGVAEALLGTCLYLTLICLFATAVAMLLRSAVATLAILLPLLFLGSQGLGNLPGLRTVTQYLPDQAGMVIMHLTIPGDHRFGRDYGPWTGLAIVLAWTAVSVLAGYLALRRRDT
jgi:ABC-2 type transport system permease protein